MAHCKITNLLEEACFGDLDFSLFKRRNSSVHHHSTVNMMKRNKTMSSWFAQKNETEQESLLTLAAKCSHKLRSQHKDAEKAVREKTKALLLSNKERNQKKKKKRVTES